MLQADVLKNYWLERLELPTFNKFFKGDEVAATLPARFVGGAYDPQSDDSDDARFLPIHIYAVGDDEYLVPTKAEWKDGHVIKHTVWLQRAQKIQFRPINDKTGKPTYNIREMTLTDDVSSDVMDSLREIIRREYRPCVNYKVQIVEPR